MKKKPVDVDLDHLHRVLEPFAGRKEALIPALQAIQEDCGYVPREATPAIAEVLGVMEVDIYGVLTFYRQFHLEPRGRHIIRVCQGTACHVMGSKDVFDYLRGNLEVEEGGTSQDGLFTLERVACLGCCGMAPVVAVDQRFHGGCTVDKVQPVLKALRKEDPS